MTSGRSGRAVRAVPRFGSSLIASPRAGRMWAASDAEDLRGRKNSIWSRRAIPVEWSAGARCRFLLRLRPR